MSFAFSVAMLAATVAARQDSPPRFEEQMIEVERGRSLFMRCIGAGPATVLFEAGGSDWSVIWDQIQQKLADHVQACAYDRAGLGSSTAAQGPRTPAALAGDIHALIATANFKRPVILVGHSLGGFNAKLVAALYPRDVAGLVLIDPAEDRSWDRTRDRLGAKYGISVAARAELADRSFFPGLVDKYLDCARVAANPGLTPETTQYRKCADPDRPALGEAANDQRRRVQATLTYQEAQASEIRWSVYADPSNDAVYTRLFRPGVFGNKPVAVLTHHEEPSDDPVDQLNSEQGLILHAETAALSRRGIQQEVSGSGHYIQLDRPDAVIAAIDRIVALVRK